MECDATYLYSGLSQHAFLTNKHNRFKKLEAELHRIVIENRNVYKFIFARSPTFHQNKFY